jgi:hypothetical protein
LIGYITLRKKYIRDYDKIIKKHCDFFADLLKGDTAWWAPTPITWRGPVGSISSVAARPSAGLAATLQDMCQWLSGSAGSQHDWTFQGNANNDYSADINTVEYNALRSRNPGGIAAPNVAEYIAQQMDFKKGNYQWGATRHSVNTNAKFMGLNDSQKSCKLIAQLLKKGVVLSRQYNIY